jgi:predicted Rossmann fold nucleotide-binding protein DprA/Smf involved in DNA uptake
MDGQLVLISPYDPAAGFNVGHAMQRNKLIYALADAALVVNSDFEKGGTWTGAVEQLDRLHFVPMFVCNGANTPRGNTALMQRGAKPWPDPKNGSELGATLLAASESVAAEPKQESLPLMVREDAPPLESPPVVIPTIRKNEPATMPEAEIKLQFGDELFETVRVILRRELIVAHTEEEIAGLLGVTKPRAKMWVARLVEEGALERIKRSKPSRYRMATASDRLL